MRISSLRWSDLSSLLCMNEFPRVDLRLQSYPFGLTTSTDRFLTSPVQKSLFRQFGGKFTKRYFSSFYFFQNVGFIMNAVEVVHLLVIVEDSLAGSSIRVWFLFHDGHLFSDSSLVAEKLFSTRIFRASACTASARYFLNETSNQAEGYLSKLLFYSVLR